VESGRITALIGPNGAGKTTAFNMISGVIRPDDGHVIYRSRDITGWPPHRITRGGIGRTFQISRPLGDMTVLENVVIQSPSTGLRSLLGDSMLARERSRGMDLLDFFGIAGLARLQAKKLSYGQKKLVELAAVMMSDPQLVMLDEPAGGVNPALLEHIVELIRQLNGTGVTFLVVEHNMDLVMQLCDSVVVLAHGRVLIQGPPDQVQRDKAVLDAYLGKA
jgi:branched-chain amino acid transport system ATP-binding protein